MNFRHLRRLTTAAAAMAALTACEADSPLAVENLDQPDVERAYSTPEGIEAILRNGFSQMLGATNVSGSLQPAAMMFSFEGFGTVANFGMNTRASIPRVPIDNTRGNFTEAENFRDFQQLSLRGRTVADAVGALDRLTAGGGSIGSRAADLRARSFGFFSVAMANAKMALMYDSVGVVRPGMEASSVPPLVHYQAAMTEALAQFDSALAIVNQAQAAGAAFDLDNTWIRTTEDTPMGMADYVRLIRSAKARYRAGVARNPTERAAVDWNLVVADAAAGIEEDVTLDLNATQGWGHGWLSQAMVYRGWHGQPLYILGMADTSGNYASWLSIPRSERLGFAVLIHTPDERFPKGATRAAQQADSPALSDVLPEKYFRVHATGDDTPGEAWGNSIYDHSRFYAYRFNSSIGPWVWMAKVEIDMLRAEGLIRLNRAAEALPLVNDSRVENDLPAFDNATSRAPAHPGGSANSCVPRTPTGPNGALECGSLFEAMKYEKRLETLFTGYAQWFIDSRGWGDLPVGTPLMWPVPFQEMDARGQAFYSSQEGPEWISGPSSYGFGTGTR